mgnify:CR=1 FL=1|tara:strand:+ start:965 stop:1837 length:873 start_codon:yes stop_codon:yes gene_type:complete
MSLNHKVFYNDKYTGAKHAFDTTRKSKYIAERLGDDNITDPSEMTSKAHQYIAECISPQYHGDLQNGGPLASSNGFQWDRGIWEMAVNSTAGVLSAVEEALKNKVSGSLSSGLHHADNTGGSGFCTVNGLAVAAKYMLSIHGVGRHIVVLDFDAHNGGGTVNSLRYLDLDENVDQFDLSTNGFDSYVEDDNHTMAIAHDDETYLNCVDVILETMGTPDLVLYNAGTDPYPTISHEALAERDQVVFNHCVSNDIPVAYVLAGGYTWSQDMDSLVGSHLETIYAADNALQLV